jgi:hypothetical protein
MHLTNCILNEKIEKKMLKKNVIIKNRLCTNTILHLDFIIKGVLYAIMTFEGFLNRLLMFTNYFHM